MTTTKIVLVLFVVLIAAVFSSPVTQRPESPNLDKHHLCGARLKQAIVQTCKFVRLYAIAENYAKNDLYEDSDSEYYDSSGSEEGSIHESREKRSIGSEEFKISTLTKCCTSGCNRADLLKFCTTEFSAPSPPTTTTTTSTTVIESESLESNESTEEEESAQTEVESETTTTSNDLVIFPIGNHGQLGNIISGASLYNRYYSYQTN